MKWVTFASRAAFDTYSLSACQAEPAPVPRPGYRADNNTTVQINNQWTQAHVGIYGVFVSTSGSFILVGVPDADVVTYSLTVAPNAPTYDVITRARRIVFEGATRTIFTQAVDYLQPKPATWTDPHDGHVYTVT